jgi:hypothetical protein
MKKLESISGNLFETQRIPNSQASKILGGSEATVHTSSTTGWQYEDTKNSNGEINVHFDKPIIPTNP